MSTLQNRWYNFLVDTLSLDRSMFQIWLPARPIEATDESLWDCGNVIPPESLIFNRDAGYAIRFSDQYAAVQGQMQPQAASIAQAIGEPHATAWSAYLATLDARPAAAALPALFQNWAARHALRAMPAGIGFLSRAALAGIAGESSHAEMEAPAYRGSYADLLGLIGASPGASGVFDSRTASADIGASWTEIDGGIVGLWHGGNGALHDKLAAGVVTASATFGACASWIVMPGGWYRSSLLATAFDNAASPPWRLDAVPSWQDFFAPGGSMRRAPASLVVVDAIDLTVTSNAAFDPAEQRLILEHAPAGLWPFHAPVSDAADTIVSFGATRGISIRTITRRGRPVVLGANVLDIARYLGRAG